MTKQPNGPRQKKTTGRNRKTVMNLLSKYTELPGQGSFTTPAAALAYLRLRARRRT